MIDFRMITTQDFTQKAKAPEKYRIWNFRAVDKYR
jgi:hypothetical protein